MEIQPYVHNVKYYETDAMGIVHHSNYIRIMEEARIDYLNQLGYNYAELEKTGVFSPVTKVECQYKMPSTFGDDLRVTILVEEITAVRIRFRYKMVNQRSVLVCTAWSEHCFVDRAGKILRIDKDYPEFFEVLKQKSDENCL